MTQSRFIWHDDPDADSRDAILVHEEGEHLVNPWMRQRHAQRSIEMYQDHKALVYRTLHSIEEVVQTDCLTRALELCCGDYISCDEAIQTAVTTVVPPGGRTRLFWYCPYPEQETVIEDALDEAQTAIGFDDRGAALAHICAVYERTYVRDWGAEG